jgi:hypothetical protein
LSQLPQWLGSDASCTHAPPQLAWPLGQLEVQVLFVHTSFGPHLTPQPPQLSGSLLVLTQALPHLA